MYATVESLEIKGSYYYITLKDRAGLYTVRQHGYDNFISLLKRPEIDCSKNIHITKNGYRFSWLVNLKMNLGL